MFTSTLMTNEVHAFTSVSLSSISSFPAGVCIRDAPPAAPTDDSDVFA